MDARTASILASTFGILGNIISFLVFLSPLPTFYKIHKTKSTQGFQSIPYSVALFSAMLYLYYAYLKKHALLLITINSTGCIIEIIYLAIFIAYATKEAKRSQSYVKVWATRLVVIFNLGTFGLIVFFTCVFTEGHTRTMIVGWICAVFSVCVFAAPLAIMRKVVKTKSVEFMPFYLSFFLTLCAVTWFAYGLLIKDYYVATPNVLGFIFGIVQMLLYVLYKDRKKFLVTEINPKPDNNKELTIVVPTDINPKSDNNNKELTIVVDIELIEINQMDSAAVHPITPMESSHDVQAQV